MANAEQRQVVLDVLANVGSYANVNAVADEIIKGVLLATKDTRWCVLVRDGDGSHRVFGPYGSVDTAKWAVQSGVLATMSHATGVIYPLIAAPRNPKRPKAASL